MKNIHHVCVFLMTCSGQLNQRKSHSRADINEILDIFTTFCCFEKPLFFFGPAGQIVEVEKSLLISRHTTGSNLIDEVRLRCDD